MNTNRKPIFICMVKNFASGFDNHLDHIFLNANWTLSINVFHLFKMINIANI